MNIQEGYHIKVYYQLKVDFPLLNVFLRKFGVHVLIKEYLQGMHKGHQINEQVNKKCVRQEFDLVCRPSA